MRVHALLVMLAAVLGFGTFARAADLAVPAVPVQADAQIYIGPSPDYYAYPYGQYYGTSPYNGYYANPYNDYYYSYPQGGNVYVFPGDNYGHYGYDQYGPYHHYYNWRSHDRDFGRWYGGGHEEHEEHEHHGGEHHH